MIPQIITGLALSLALAASSNGGPQKGSAQQVGSDREIRIRIRNYARANPSVVLHAKRAAGDILREAGVNALWVECPIDPDDSRDALCGKPLSSLDFVLNLLPRSMSDRFHLRGGVLGFAFVPEGRDFGSNAFIFYDVAKDCAQQHQDLDQLLGDAIAHELGHLLLGTNSHSSSGLMSASWSRKQLVTVQQRGLAFSTAEAERIQKAVLARRLAALSAAESSESPTAVPLAAVSAR
jgi:hypothetical protein